ncbi:MAG: hypothetical protein OXR62_11345 [Ahrensia sp.]|nr:hypothetical protein [Ahrensia sp.]
MSFFESFHALGYSAINLVFVFAVVIVVIFRALSMHKKSPRTQVLAALVLLAIAAAPFAMATSFLASENQRLNDAVRAEGGIKQNFPEN